MGLPTPLSTAVSFLTRLSGGAHAAATFIALATLPLMATSVSAHVWWIAQGVDGRWNTYNNWILGYFPHTPTIPDETFAAYVTTSEHEGLSDLPAALIDESIAGDDKARAKQLYLGGWPAEFDGNHGDPLGHSGVLNITGGELHVANYTRLGTRGGEGTINQSGGTVTNDLAITIGWLSGDSVGTYNLDGGSVFSTGIHIGLQGTGYLNMSGGRVDVRGASVGDGFTSSDGPYIPGLGVLNLSGGTFEADYLLAGGFEDSYGTILVHGDAVLAATGVTLGLDSFGSMIQSGGTIDVGWKLRLGYNAEGVGEYTIEGGTLHSGSLYVGRVGSGKLTIVGSAAQIDIAGVYEQNGLSDLTVILDGSEDHLTTITVGSTATFADGAELRIRLADDYSPSMNDAFTVLTAAQGVIDHGLQLVDGALPPFASKDWTLDTSSGDSVTVIYTPRNKRGFPKQNRGAGRRGDR